MSDREDHELRQSLTRFFTALLALFGVAAGVLYISDPLGRYLFVSAVALAAAWALLPRLIDIGQKIRAYPSLVERVGELQTTNEHLRESAAAWERAAESAYEQGIEEGQLRIYGPGFARNSLPLTVIATSFRDGRLALVAQYAEPPEGSAPPHVLLYARFDLQVAATGERKGIMQVVKIDQAQRNAYLEPIDTSEAIEYWAALEETAAGNPSPPPGIALVPAKYELPRALQRGSAAHRQIREVSREGG